jgi:hypothetical protein
MSRTDPEKFPFEPRAREQLCTGTSGKLLASESSVIGQHRHLLAGLLAAIAVTAITATLAIAALRSQTASSETEARAFTSDLLAVRTARRETRHVTTAVRNQLLGHGSPSEVASAQKAYGVARTNLSHVRAIPELAAFTHQADQVVAELARLATELGSDPRQLETFDEHTQLDFTALDADADAFVTTAASRMNASLASERQRASRAQLTIVLLAMLSVAITSALAAVMARDLHRLTDYARDLSRHVATRSQDTSAASSGALPAQPARLR